jgi:hypothetical protein
MALEYPAEDAEDGGQGKIYHHLGGHAHCPKPVV